MLKRFKTSRKTTEQGFTLVEILVAVVLLALVSVGVTTTIVALSATTQNFTASATTQNQAADAISEMTRDISAATSFTYADDYRISFITKEDNTSFEVSYFYWDPAGGGPTVPDGVNTSNLPDTNALVQYRKEVGALSGTESVLVTGYDLGRQETVLFTFFNKTNKDMVTPILNTDLNSIVRVQYRFALKVEDRNALIELASSATPRYAVTDINNGGVGNVLDTCYAPTTSGSLAPQTRTANISWTSVANANTYTVYRTNPNQPINPKVVAVINTYTTTTYTDTTVDWGEKYYYFVIAGCAVGTSPQSNSVQLSVTPDRVVIINQNTTKALADVKTAATEAATTNPVTGRTYTVARGLTNQITWAPQNGAEGYLVFRNGTQIGNVSSATLSYQDTGRAYGETSTYTVLAYNTGQNGSGGNGQTSVGKQLISPPVASVITATAQDTSTNSATSSNLVSVTTRAANTTGYTTQRNTTQSSAASCASASSSSAISALAFTGSSVQDTDILWGSSTCYVVTGYNDAGPGLPSNAATANQLPGKFSVVSLNETGLRSQVTSYYELDPYGQGGASSFNVDWSDSTNAASYSARKVITTSAGTYIDSADQTNNTGTTSNIAYGNTTPGTLYTITVQAAAANGLSRTVTSTFVTAPEPPAQAHSIIQARNPYPSMRRMTQIALWTTHGMASTLEAKAWFQAQGEPGYSSWGASAGAWGYATSSPADGGDTAAAARSYLSYAGWNKYSATLWWTGSVDSSGCSYICNNDFNNIEEAYPDYWAGHHAYYVIN